MIKVKAIFLDRDGVICEEENLNKKEKLKLIKDSAKAISLLNKNNYKVIIMTNQAAISRGLSSTAELDEFHIHMKNKLFEEAQAKIDKIYFCPHHPQYTIECECRKPKPGMILQACADFNIRDLSECYIVGDKTIDIKAGKLAGCKTILVKTGYGGNDCIENISPMFVENNLYNAVVNIILK